MRKSMIILTAFLSGLVLIAGGIAVSQRAQAQRAQSALRNVYESAVLDSLQNLNDMRIKIEKALLSEETGASAQLLSAVASGAAGVRQSLQVLPTQSGALTGALKFANQLADYAAMLTKNVENGIDQGQAETLESLIATCEELTRVLEDARGSMTQGSVQSGDAAQSETQNDLSYPTLIYDGPFSDGIKEGEAKYLSQLPDITREEAIARARDFLGASRVQSLQNGTDSYGKIPCFGVSAVVDDGLEVQLAVTRQGGKILFMSPEHADFESVVTVEKCREAAGMFLEEQGFPDMESTYFQVYGGVAVVHFAATQGSVTLYPDLIKVQVRMDTARVVGVEMRNYLTNHTARGDLSAVFSREDALGAVSARLTIDDEKTRLCVIPLGQEEKLCWELHGTFSGGNYLVYIDAKTGAQREILKIVESESGLKTV